MMDHSPLAVLLMDLQRAGVSDIVLDDTFDMRADKIYPLSQMPEGLRQKSNALAGAQAEQLSESLGHNATASLDVSKKDSSKPQAISDDESVGESAVELREIPVWAFGVETAKVAVLISAPVAKESAPLDRKEQQLFAKMMASIEVGASDVVFLVMQEMDDLTSEEADVAKSKLSGLVSECAPEGLLVVGRTMRQVLSENTFAGKPCIQLEHPATLLSHPSLKRGAWHNLLAFKNTVLLNQV